MHDKLVATDIIKFYNKKKILDKISITVETGEAVGIFGPNGAGKTTCFNIFIGLTKPDGGSITLNNKDITSLPVYLRSELGLGYLPQESSIFRGLSVKNNIIAILEIKHKDKTE